MKFIPSDLCGRQTHRTRCPSRSSRFFCREPIRPKNFAKSGIDTHIRAGQPFALRGERGAARLALSAPSPRAEQGASHNGGAIYDVVVDLRRASPTFGQWRGFDSRRTISACFSCPPGFAHGFCTLAENTEVQYKVDRSLRPGLRRRHTVERSGHRHRVAPCGTRFFRQRTPHCRF